MRKRLKRLEDRSAPTQAAQQEREERRARIVERLWQIAEEGPEITEEERAAEREWERNNPLEAKAQIQELKDAIEARKRGRQNHWRGRG